MSKYRRYQILSIAVDALTSLLVWLVFLLFRWLVYEGRVLNVESVLIPAFDFYRPLFIYPLVCLAVYYLSGYYIRPFQHKYTQELLQTLLSSCIITLGAFFAIIIDDNVAGSDYHRYLVSLMVLGVLQFSICYLPRVFLTTIMRKRTRERSFTIHSYEQVQSFRTANQVLPFDEVIIDLPSTASERELYTIINALYPNHINISIVPRLYDFLTGAASIGDLKSSPLIRITDTKMTDSELCIKRAFDIVSSAMVLVLLSPLYLVIALLVKLSSPGPILYSQERIGHYGRSFRILKFRTMYADSEGDTPQLSQENDPRITRIGHVLRKYRLDELPQMINILRGDMSFVGPRPERAYFIEQIEQQAPYYCLLYKIRPGLTSWGPIRVGYTDTMEKMIQRLNYDIVYMENMSLWLDVKILFYTLGVIIDGKGK